MLTITDLSFQYPRSQSLALQGLSLSIPTGSLFGLLGPNGSGKTTLISLMAGVLKVQKGSLVHSLPQTRLSLVPQEYAFYPRLSLQENLDFFGAVQGLGGRELSARIVEALQTTGLESAARTRAEHCSGGMKRRLNIAIGLLNRPQLLFLDEPTVGIDPQSRHFILQSIRAINAQGCTVVYSSHYMEEIEMLCDRIAVLDRGQLLLEGGLEELLAARGRGKLEELFLSVTHAGLRD